MKHLYFARVCLIAIYGIGVMSYQAHAEMAANSSDAMDQPSERATVSNNVLDARQNITMTLSISDKETISVKTQDEPGVMTWDAAVGAVRSLGDDWRLPTIAELKTMYDRRTAIGGFEREDYWSSTEQDVNSAWIQGFRMGDQDRYNKQSKLKVRAVRSFRTGSM